MDEFIVVPVLQLLETMSVWAYNTNINNYIKILDTGALKTHFWAHVQVEFCTCSHVPRTCCARTRTYHARSRTCHARTDLFHQIRCQKRHLCTRRDSRIKLRCANTQGHLKIRGNITLRSALPHVPSTFPHVLTDFVQD